MHRAGCRFGDECHYLHPKLCNNSVSMKTCYNESCKLVHLKFTKRSPPAIENHATNGRQSRNYQDSRNYQYPVPNSYEQRSSKQREQGYNNQPRWSSNNAQHNTQNPFLEERMKKLEQSILQSVKQMINQQLWNTEETYNTEFPHLEPGW